MRWLGRTGTRDMTGKADRYAGHDREDSLRPRNSESLRCLRLGSVVRSEPGGGRRLRSALPPRAAVERTSAEAQKCLNGREQLQ